MVIKMKNKVIAILVSLLFIEIIPSALGMNSNSEDKEPWSSGNGRFTCRGLVFDPPFNSNPDLYFAIWLFYKTEEGVKLILLDWVIIRLSVYMGRMYEVGLGLFIYIFGIFEGGLEPLE